MTGVSTRRVAIDALVRVEEGAYSNVALPSILRSTKLDQRDRAFVTELVYGTLREQRALDATAQDALDRPLEELDAPVRAALRLGTFQLRHNVAPHAAVGETVAAAPLRARGLVNAVLRKVAASPQTPEHVSLGVRTSHPDWIVDVYERELGALAIDALEANNRPARVTLRPRQDPDQLAAELEAAGADVTRGTLLPSAILVRGAGDPATLPAVRDGRATPQDQASQAVVAVLAPQLGERVADLAAAPGGKTTAIAERVRSKGHVVASDLHGGRLRLVADAARRLHLANISVIRSDARFSPLRPHTFDRVLLDAPCSGLGVLRRRPEARWRVQPDDVVALAMLQRELLGAAVPLLRPNGRLVYSVCTITTEETTEIDAWLAQTLPKLVAEPPLPQPWIPRGRGALLVPGTCDADGMYVLTLRLS